MKKILMISYHTCPLASQEGKETGGMNIYVHELSQELARLGYHVDVITRCQDNKNPKIVQVQENYRVIHLVAGPQAPIPKKKLGDFMPQFTQSFKKFREKEQIQYDVVHAHYYQSGLIGLEILKDSQTKIPLIMTFHTLALMKNLVARTKAELDSQFRLESEFKLMKEATAIIAPSSSDKQYLQYLYDVPNEKICEIPPGVNTELFKPVAKSLAKQTLGVGTHEKIILFVGRIEPLKGIDVLLYALKILLTEAPDLSLKLMIVGGDISQHITKWSPQLKQLEKLRNILGISCFVEFVGQRPQNELPLYYNAADIVVMPSHYESFGIAAAEAMACGTPVITTNVTGISTLIDESRATLITTVNNPLLLASQINELLTDQQTYQKIQKNSIEYTRNLHWNKIAKRIEAVYQKFTA